MTGPKLHVVTPPVEESSSDVSEAKSSRRPSAKPPAKVPSARRKSTAPKVSTVSELMSTEPVYCTPHDTVNTVARLMWDNDVGAIVVVDDAHRPMSIVTDRDIAMAAYTQGMPLASIAVSSCMSKVLHTCRETDSPNAVLQTMQTCRVRRVPVVDGGGSLVGLLGMTDLLRSAAKKRAKAGVTGTQLIATLSGILT